INSGLGTQIYNYGLWNAQSDNSFLGGAYGDVTAFDNFGTFQKSGNTGTTTLDGSILFTNAGTLDAQSGTLSLNTYDLTGGALNSGINSLTSFGIISLAGSATLTGTVSANLNNNYVPSVSDSFPVLNFSSSSGGFTNFSSPLGVIWQTNYAATSFILTYAGQIVWATPTNITYGTPLGANQLAASTTPTVAGTFTYNPVSGTLLDSGAGQWLTTAFSPSDPTYAPASFQVPITVLKAPLGIAADAETKNYGKNFIFTGTEFVATGLVNGDTVTNVSFASTGAISNAPVSGSPYEITPYNAEGDAGLTNYIIRYTNTVLTVNRAPLGITADSFAKPYGSNVIFTGTEFFATLSNNETIGRVAPTSAGAISNAPVSGSPYSIFPGSPSGGTFSTGNYAITYTNGLLTVNRADLTVTANPASRQYGVANPAFNATYSGFVNNETAGVVSGMPGFSTPATLTSGIGSYSLTPSLGALTAANYTFAAYDNGALTITTAPLMLSSGITANNKVYDRTTAASLSSNNVVLATLYNGDAISLNTNGYIANFTSSNVANGIAVTVSGLTLGGARSTNYTLTQPSLTANITAAPVTITSGLTANSKIYNRTTVATLSSNNVVLSGVIGSDTVTLNTNGYVANFATSNAANGIAVSVSDLTLSGASAPNYALAQPGSLTASITEAPVTITSGITANNKVYDRTTAATLSSNNVVLSGVINGDTAILNTNAYTATFASTGLGSDIAVTVSGLTLSGSSASDYSLTEPTGLAADITAPEAQISPSLANIIVSWPTNATVFILNQTASLVPPISWSPVTNSVTVNGANNTVTISSESAKNQYFELIAAP
ncbi:MAG TPA: YDG domain-containing protein, partial [Verrucomicrobiae bacterium]|nr:YDG domain-containing protein [Verrucomicrobiae bacterium]